MGLAASKAVLGARIDLAIRTRFRDLDKESLVLVVDTSQVEESHTA